ncbi:MAG: AAA family ATPase [Polyangiaceae bacterium]|nr:AAA family ATPase [Polyangiaceae bacterium]
MAPFPAAPIVGAFVTISATVAKGSGEMGGGRSGVFNLEMGMKLDIVHTPDLDTAYRWWSTPPMSVAVPIAHVTNSARSPLDARFVTWLAVQVLQDRHARLVEGGADADAQKIDLASIFVDLPLQAQDPRFRTSEKAPSAMPQLLGMHLPEPSPSARSLMELFDTKGGGPRMLLVGRTGIGKSTLTTMVAQVLRMPWIARQVDALPADLRETWQQANAPIEALLTTSKWAHAGQMFPLRISLPLVARWFGSRVWRTPPSVWDYLAARMRVDLAKEEIACDVEPAELRRWIEAAGNTYWILDGLDEVPHSANRKQVVEAVRAVTCGASQNMNGVLVSTRPQGYGGEFDDLMEHELVSLPKELAHTYAEKLLRAWSGQTKRSQLDEQLERLRTELEKPAAAALLHTPLHTTMAALLVANQGQLPNARSILFRDYFATILRRELNKPIDHGIRSEDEGALRSLHERAGLTLQVRSQQGASARPTLRQRELREMLSRYYVEKRCADAEVQANVARIMRFAMDRLVLLLHSSEGEYEFGVRSLQEYFAAEALVDDDIPLVKKRLEAVAANPHWGNVLRLIASRCILDSGKKAQRIVEALVATCRALNEGTIGGEAAKRCFAGSRLAIAILEETCKYGHPDLYEPLWQIALEAAASPLFPDIGSFVVNWPDTKDATKYRGQVLRVAKTLFEAGGDAYQQGWRLLDAMLHAQVDEAVALAERHAPTTEVDARAVFWPYLLRGQRVPPWIARFIEQNVQWFPPQVMLGWREGDILFLGQAHIELFTRQFHQQRHRILIRDTDDKVCGWAIQSIECDAQWQSLVLRTPDTSPAWALWKRIATFMVSPSHDCLADVLEAANSEALLAGLQPWLMMMLPWPIAATMRHVRSYLELPALAAQARAGELGTVDDWRAAERRWRDAPHASLEEVETALISPVPWGPDIALRGKVFPYLIEWLREDPNTLVPDWRSRFLRLAVDHPNAVHRLLPYLEHMHRLEPKEEFPLVVARLVDENVPFDKRAFVASPLLLAPDLSGPNREEWFVFFDARGRRGTNARWGGGDTPDVIRERTEANVAALVERIAQHPDQWGLLDTLVALLLTVSNADLSKLRLPELPPDAPPRAFALHALLALVSGGTDKVLFERLVFEHDGVTHDFRHELAGLLWRRNMDPGTKESLWLGMLEAAPPPRRNLRDQIQSAFFKHLHDTLEPSFLTRAAWTEHELPEPCLVEQTTATRPAPRIVQIVELRNVRIFKETPSVDEKFPQPAGDQGQWIVLVGENGVGKTTLLRAIALAVAPPAIGSKLLDESNPPMLANGGEGPITIELDTGLLSVAIRRDERTEIVEARSTQEVSRPWIVGYGVKRGNARGEKDRPAEVGPIGELHTLFDRPASLYNAAQWLENLDADVLREQRRSPRPSETPPTGSAGIWKAVVHALRVLLGIQDVSVEPGGLVYVQHKDFGRVRLDTLSDGYLTTTGWIIDMIARWVERQRELDESVGADVLRQMTGLVLVDEIDLHLHPIWQMHIIDDVRRLFPNLSFVVTTHNPLVLQGARRGEVYVMRRGEQGRIELVQKDIRPGQDVDRVLFEQFGVEYTFDRETRDLLARHRDLLARGAGRDDPQRMALEKQIETRFGSLGSTLRKERDATMGPVAPFDDEERARFLAEMQRLADEEES